MGPERLVSVDRFRAQRCFDLPVVQQSGTWHPLRHLGRCSQPGRGHDVHRHCVSRRGTGMALGLLGTRSRLHCHFDLHVFVSIRSAADLWVTARIRLPSGRLCRQAYRRFYWSTAAGSASASHSLGIGVEQCLYVHGAIRDQQLGYLFPPGRQGLLPGRRRHRHGGLSDYGPAWRN